MDYFGRRSPKPSPVPQLEEGVEKKYNRIEDAFLRQATLAEELSSHLENYEMCLRDSKKCLHALTDTMSELYQNMGPSDKEFKIAMEDHERLLEYKAHAIHNVNNGAVNKFRETHNHGKRLVREREASKREHEAASEALRKLYKMGKGSDRRVPRMEAEMNTMSQRLNETTDLAMRDLPLALLFRGSFISEIFPNIFRTYREYSQESIKVSDVLCDIVKQLEGIYLGFDAHSRDKFFSTKSIVMSKYLKKYSPLTFEEEEEEEDDDNVDDDHSRMQVTEMKNNGRQSPNNTQEKRSPTPPGDRSGQRRTAPLPLPQETDSTMHPPGSLTVTEDY